MQQITNPTQLSDRYSLVVLIDMIYDTWDTFYQLCLG